MSVKIVNKLDDILDTMAYADKGTENLEGIQKWLKGRENALTSMIDNAKYTDENHGKVLPIKDLSEVFGGKVTASILTESSLVEAYRVICSKSSTTGIIPEDKRMKRRQELRELLIRKMEDLRLLVALATNVSPELVKRENENAWLDMTQSEMSSELRDHIEEGNLQILLRLGRDTCYLNSFIPLLSAAIQMDGPILIFVSLDKNSLCPVLPISYLTDAVNESRIRNGQINLLFANSESFGPELFLKLSEVDQSLKLKKSSDIMAMGDQTRHPVSPSLITTAAVNLSEAEGKSIHYIIDSSADVSSGVLNMANCAWAPGAEISLRCRGLAFIHTSIFSRVVSELQEVISNKTVQNWQSSPLKSCDFVSRRVNSPSEGLRSIVNLGVKYIAKSVGFEGPTVVYDMGTSSDLIAVKEPGLGHVLVLIKFRSIPELVSLANNFGVPDQLLVFSAHFNTTTNILKSVHAQEIIVNSSVSQRKSPLGSSWKVLRKTGTPTMLNWDSSSRTTEFKEPSLVLKERILPDSSMLEKVLVAAGVKDTWVLTKLLAFRLSVSPPNVSYFPSKPGPASVTGIIAVDINETPMELFTTALIAAILRGKPVVIVTINTKVDPVYTNIISHLPNGFLTFVSVKNADEMSRVTAPMDLVWVLQGATVNFDVGFLPASNENRILLVNTPGKGSPLYNAKVAIESAFKVCYM